jgi:hypothetical protein
MLNSPVQPQKLIYSKSSIQSTDTGKSQYIREVNIIWKDPIEAQEEILVQGKCIRQLVQNVTKNVKFRSSLQKESQFIAKNAI